MTYPAPPGESAVPEAIASVAGGTGTAPTAIASNNTNPIGQVAGFDTKAGSTAVTGSLNDAAARANGFNLASSRSDTAVPQYASKQYASKQYAGNSIADASRNSEIPAIPTGYKFGTKSAAPTAGLPGASSLAKQTNLASTLPNTTGTTGRFAMPSSYPVPGMQAKAPGPQGIAGVSAGSNPIGGISLPTGSPTSGAKPTATTGFSMPEGALPSALGRNATTSGGLASNPQPFMPKATNSTSLPPTPELTSPSASVIGQAPSTANAAGNSLPTGNSLPNSPSATSPTSPNYRTASAALSPRASSGALAPSSNALPASGSGSSGYAPGSTAGASGYPATSGYPTTGTEGSFYR